MLRNRIPYRNYHLVKNGNSYYIYENNIMVIKLIDYTYQEACDYIDLYLKRRLYYEKG